MSGKLSMIIVMVFMGNVFSAAAQITENIILFKPLPLPFQPREYFIKRVIDNREVKGAIGKIITSQVPSLKYQNVILKEGLPEAVSEFIAKSSGKLTGSRPIIDNIRELIMTETNQSVGWISGTLQISISFEIERSNGPVKLIEYKGGTRYSRPLKQLSVIEPVINKSIIHALEYFNTWINREAATNELLAEKVRINFVESEKKPEKDSLFYSSGKRLSWSDFKGRPEASSQFAAEIFPFFSLDESAKIDNSVINVDINLNIYLVRSFSWVKDYARNPYTLNHEQRHFDLVKVIAERFKKKIRNENVSVDTYEGILSAEYLASLSEMNLLEKKYDAETKHGTDEAAQEKWNLLIDKELSTFRFPNQ